VQSRVQSHQHSAVQCSSITCRLFAVFEVF